MALTPGSRVGPYEIVSAIGAGGMGEVYRARDTRLNRDVAIKALPELFSLDPERVARFEREAQLLAALSHPNIGGIHGLEESRGARYLILELIPGESLVQRIASGPVPVNEALGIARQIAEALEAAHEKGIIHRDLKPGNVMLTPEGQVKVLDFGLAKAMDAGSSSGSVNPTGGLQNSPTFTSPAMTAVGLVLGTAAYMAPEQAKGRVADKRSDVWAFGAVLYELLTGTNAFSGEDVSDTLAAVLRGEPDWTCLPKDTPPPIERLARRCLQKDRKQRIPDISVARFEIDECLAGRSVEQPAPAVRPASRWRTAMLMTGGMAAGAAAASALFAFVLWPRPVVPTVSRFEMKPPADTRIAVIPAGAAMDVAISADGSRIAYMVGTGAGSAIAVRRLDESESTLLPGTNRAQSHSLSPDGTRVVFHAGGKLHLLVIGASSPAPVCDTSGQVLGTRWLDNDTIVYAARGLFRVPAVGGAPQPIVEAEPDTTYGFPEVLPGGRALIYATERGGQRRLMARALPSGEPQVLVENASMARYVASGHLLFMQAGRLLGAPFDPSRLKLTGTPAPVGEEVSDKFSGAGGFDVSPNGTFATTVGDALPYISRFIIKSRDGAVAGSVGPDGLEYPRYPRVSPDGKRLVATIGPGSRGHLWVFDLAGSVQPLKLTFNEHNLWPTWTADGKTLLFARVRSGGSARAEIVAHGLMAIPSDGSNLTPRMILKSSTGVSTLPSVSPDGRFLLYAANTETGGGSDLMVKALDEEGDGRPWLAEAFQEREPAFSPDGKWVAFVSTQSGGPEIWVRPFPGPGAPIRVSPAGGREPIWARNFKELFYQQGQKLMSAAVLATSPELRFAQPRLLFEGGFVPFGDTTPRTYDVLPDGRFLMIEERVNPSRSVLTVATGFDQVLKSRLPR